LNINMAGNLVAGNLKGGLINLTLKSLGSIQKGGSRAIVDFVDYGDKVTANGLSIMNGPGNDFESITGITASGANIFLFSTGMGTTEGSLISPIIKVASNTRMYERLSDDMDFNAGAVLEDGIEVVAYKLMDLVIQVASGEMKTASERHKKRAFQIWSAGKLSL
ncbi:MAG: UxaA family hydrolase, partial [Campylobacteraceae bacterium]|nr:UxaA family hydrolase [Campylobacteraceae bacterium]